MEPSEKPPQMKPAEDPASTQSDGEAIVHASESGEATSRTPDEIDALTTAMVEALKTVFDPEIPVDIYELGLIYRVEVDDDGLANILMTLTAPGCPVAEDMPIWVRDAALTVPGVREAKVALTFDPPWTPERMSEEAKIALGWF